jgi:hypothetical protein
MLPRFSSAPAQIPGAEPLRPLLCFFYLDGSHGRMSAVGLLITLISILLSAVAQGFLGGKANSRTKIHSGASSSVARHTFER